MKGPTKPREDPARTKWNQNFPENVPKSANSKNKNPKKRKPSP